MPTLQLYPFRFRDPRTGKWMRARHKMQVPVLQRSYSEWEIIGAPEIRHILRAGAPEQFSPFIMGLNGRGAESSQN